MAIHLSNASDNWTGTSASEEVYGHGGGDILRGMGGNDIIHGDDGMGGTDGWDWINGGAGNDYMYGGEGNDTFEVGGIYSGNVGGLNSGWDKYDGEDGNGDRIRIAPTAGWVWTAIMIDGTGLTPGIDNVEIIENDSTGPGYVYVRGDVNFGDVTQWIDMNLIVGSANADKITGSDVADPTIEAGNGDDEVYGMGGGDTIYGLNGNDTLDGGEGENHLYGGAGADTFVVSTDYDLSTIHDFDDGTEKIHFTSNIADDYSDLSISNDMDGNAHVIVGTVDITVAGVDSASLSPADFMFV
jgi:Ca2+-binding RTX toxin-like protein